LLCRVAAEIEPLDPELREIFYRIFWCFGETSANLFTLPAAYQKCLRASKVTTKFPRARGTEKANLFPSKQDIDSGGFML